MGWFYGFKLHLVINEQGEILDVELTPGNTDDRRPLPKFAEGLPRESLCGSGVYLQRPSGTAPCARDQLGLQGPKEHETPDLSVSDEVLLRKRNAY